MFASAALLGQFKRRVFNSGMRTIADIRRENLEALVRELGTLEEVATLGNTSSVYLSQVRRQALDRKTKRPREMGSGIARRLEAGCRKQPGWMDEPHYPSAPTSRTEAREPPVIGTLASIEVDAVLALRALPQRRRNAIVADLMREAEDAQQFAAEVLARQGVTVRRGEPLLGAGLPVRPDGEQHDTVPAALTEVSRRT